jgi:hypothetical protein
LGLSGTGTTVFLCFFLRLVIVTKHHLHKMLGKNKITQNVCLRAGEMFVQANIIESIMRRDNGYFATSQISKVR